MQIEQLLWLVCLEEGNYNKNTFQWDAYHPLVNRIPTCTAQGGVPRGSVCPGGCLPLVPGGMPPCNGADTSLLCGWTDTCEHVTFVNFVCGR